MLLNVPASPMVHAGKPILVAVVVVVVLVTNGRGAGAGQARGKKRDWRCLLMMLAVYIQGAIKRSKHEIKEIPSA